MNYSLVDGEVEISTDTARLDRAMIYDFLTHSYWAEGIPQSIVERSIDNSLCFGAYRGGMQVGFARVISDRATYAYVADVFVLENARGKGIGKSIMRCIMTHPELQGLRRWSLLTRDAHGLYSAFGFGKPLRPERYMEISNPTIYKSKQHT